MEATQSETEVLAGSVAGITKREGCVLGLSPWLGEGHLHIHMAFFQCVCVSKFLLSIRTLVIVDLGPS